MARKIITEFKNKVKSDYLTLHWDGKLLKQISGQKLEYLTVLVSGFPNCVEGKILSMKPLQSGTGLAIC